MGLQLIVLVETDVKCKSDWIYIKETIEHFFEIDQTQIKLTPVYLGGKSKYDKKSKEISKLKSQYCATCKENDSVVLLCLDCDDYDIKSEDKAFLENAKRYCDNNGIELVWFCKDIERVYMGEKIPNTMKKAEATKFKAKGLINKVDKASLSANDYSQNCSNIISVLKKYLKERCL